MKTGITKGKEMSENRVRIETPVISTIFGLIIFSAKQPPAAIRNGNVPEKIIRLSFCTDKQHKNQQDRNSCELQVGLFFVRQQENETSKYQQNPYGCQAEEICKEIAVIQVVELCFLQFLKLKLNRPVVVVLPDDVGENDERSG